MKKCESKHCSRPHYAKGLCKSHYARQWKGNEDDSPINRNPGEWGKWYLTTSGYRQQMRSIPNPLGGRGFKERRYEHRVVWEEAHGSLVGTQNIHHKNGDRADNRIENLELWDTSQPPGQRVEDKLMYARMIFDRYAPPGEVWTNA